MPKVTNSAIHVLNTALPCEAQVNAASSPEDLIQQAAIERLRASKRKDCQYKASRGEKDGRQWALLEADHSDLVYMSKINLSTCWGLKDHMWMADSALEGRDDEDYLLGFLKGAQEFFHEVKDQL